MTDFLSVPQHQLTLSGNTAGALAALSSGTVTIAGGNNITVSQAGNAITISGANAGGAQTAISGIANSETTYTSGTVSLSELGAITIRSTTGQAFQFSVNSQTVQTQNLVDVTLSGNTAGALALISSGTMTLAGGNNITVSQAGNAVTISGPNVGGAQTGISGLANSETTYTSGTVSLSELGAITIRSTTGQQFQFSVNPQSVQPETQTFVGGISASDTLYTSGTVRFTGSQAITVRSGTGQLVVIDAPVQSVQPETQTFVGGISASDTLYTSGTVRFTGVGGGVTVSSNTGQRVDISVAAQSVQPETQTFVGGIGNSQTTYTSGTVNLSVVAGQLTIRSTTGQAFQFSASQSVQPETQTAISGIANSETTYTSGTVSLSELGAITIRSTTGNQFQFSVNAQTTQTQGILSAGVSNLGNTAGNTTVNTGSRLVIVGSNGITASQGTAAGATTITLSGITQTVQTQGILSAGVSTGGNTAGDTTVNTGSRFVLVGTNMVSLSQTTGAGATTISINATNQNLSLGVSTGGNTVGNTTVNSGSRFVIVASGNATASQATAAGASTVTISVGTQTVQTQGILSAGVSTGGNTAGNTTVNTGSRMVFVGSNMVSLSQTTAAGATTISFNATQTVQTNDIPRLGVSTGGNTSGDTTVNSGTRFVLVGSNGITLSQGTAASATTVTISGITQSVQTQGILNVALSNIGNTSGDTGLNSGTRMVLAGGNNVTLSASSAANATTVTISTPNMVSVGMSTQGNTAGDTGYATQRLNLVGSNNITLSGSTNGGSMTISIAAPSPGAAQYSIGVSDLGNTAGSTGVTGTRIVFVGTNNISLSQSTDANGATISINQTGGGGFSGGMSTEGNTAGNTGVTGTRLVFVGTGPISLSQTTGAAGGTLSINAPATSSLSATGNVQISTNGSTISIGDGGQVLDFWDNLVPGASTTFTLPNATMHVWPLNPANAGFPGYMSVSTMFMDFSGTVSTAAAFTRSLSIGFYTRVNSTQLSLSASASTSWGTNAGNMNIGDSMAGRRWVTLHSSQFNNAPNFSNGSDYFMAVWDRSSSGSQTFTYQGMLLPYYTGIRSGFMNAASATNTTLGQYPFLGNYSVSFTTAMPNALAASDVNKSNATAISLPRIIFNNVGTNII